MISIYTMIIFPLLIAMTSSFSTIHFNCNRPNASLSLQASRKISKIILYRPSKFSLGQRLAFSDRSSQFHTNQVLDFYTILRSNISDFDSNTNTNNIDFNKLMVMDVVLFSQKNSPDQKIEIGALQEDGTLAPLSAWSLENAFYSSSSSSSSKSSSEMIEFVVDEHDRWKKEYDAQNISIHYLLDENLISYGSRQVGGGKGPGNPHGEESELIYYVDKQTLDQYDVSIPIKPELEILW